MLCNISHMFNRFRSTITHPRSQHHNFYSRIAIMLQVMPLENEMKKPKNFGSVFGVLNIAMIPITLLYTFVGFFGYLKYGHEVQGALTLSLPEADM